MGRRGRGGHARAVRRRRPRGRRGRGRRRAAEPRRRGGGGRQAGTPRWRPRPTPRPPRSRSSAARTSASRACSTRCSARSGRSSREVPGTTRDAIDTRLAWGRSEVVLIDTAGIRRRGKVASGPAAERYSTMRALKRPLARGRGGARHRRGRGADRAGRPRRGLRRRGGQGPRHRGQQVGPRRREDGPDLRPVLEWIRNEVPFLDFAPIISISAKTGQRVGRVLEAAVDIWGERRRRDPDRGAQPAADRLDRADAATDRPRPAAEAVLRHPGRASRRRRSCSSPRMPSAVHFSYRRYLENRLRETFGFDGTPIRLVFRDRTSVKLPRAPSQGRGDRQASRPRRRSSARRARRSR